MGDGSRLGWNNAIYLTSFRYEKPPPRRGQEALEKQYKGRQGDVAARELKTALEKDADTRVKSEWDEGESTFYTYWEKKAKASSHHELTKEEKLAAKAIVILRREALKKLYDSEEKIMNEEEKSYDAVIYNKRNQ